MRAMVVGPMADWSTADVAVGWVEGLEACGVRTSYFDLLARVTYYTAATINDLETGEPVKVMEPEEVRRAATLSLLSEVYRFDPDLVVVIHGTHVWPPFISELRCKVVLVLTECPYEDEAQTVYAGACRPDLILLNDPLHQGVFAQIAPSFYVPHAYRPEVHHPGRSDRKSDVCFIGTGFPNRVELFEAVDWSGVDLALGGMWALCAPDSPLRDHLIDGRPVTGEGGAPLGECVDNDDTADWYRGTRIGVNLYRGGVTGEHSRDDGYAIGPREVELAACQTMFLRDPRPESDELFPFLPSFDGPDELGALIREWLPRDDERRALARRAAAAVADRTFANHAGRLLRRLGL